VRYALLGYSGDRTWESLTDEERAGWAVDDAALNAELTDRGCVVHGEGLADVATATTVRVRNGDTLFTDGPCLDAPERLGGILVIDVPDLDAALDVARRCPAARTGAIEVRPVRSD
jgi:hypothetical protein